MIYKQNTYRAIFLLLCQSIRFIVIVMLAPLAHRHKPQLVIAGHLYKKKSIEGNEVGSYDRIGMTFLWGGRKNYNNYIMADGGIQRNIFILLETY